MPRPSRYQAVHARLKRTHGPASQFLCTVCDGQADEWAYDQQDPEELREGGKTYSPDVSHYTPMCRSCHRLADKRGTCKNGHPWTEETTYQGKHQRYCRKCRTEYMRRYRRREKENANG